MKRVATALSAIACLALAGLVGCQGPAVTPTDTNQTSTTTPPPAPTSSAPAMPSNPSLLPYSVPADGSAPVIINDDGTGFVIIGMSVDEFYQQAATANWVCSPPDGPGDDGFVYVGKTAFIFGQSGLFRVDVADDSFQTQRGLKVGDSVDELTSLYGLDYELDNASDKDTYTYSLPSGRLFYAVVDEGTTVISGWGMA